MRRREKNGICGTHSPASVAKGDVEGIGLGGLAGQRNETIRVEGHRVLVDLGIVHEVPVVYEG